MYGRKAHVDSREHRHGPDANPEEMTGSDGENGYRFEDESLQAASALFDVRANDTSLHGILSRPNVVPRSSNRKSSGSDEATTTLPEAQRDKSQRARFGSLPGKIAASIALAAALPFGALAAAFAFSEAIEETTHDLVSAALNGPEVVDEVSIALACASRARVADASHQGVSWLPVRAGCLQPGEIPGEGETLSPHLFTSTVHDDRSVELLAPAIAALEGDHNGPGTLYALNARGLGRVFIRELQRLWSPELSRFGGSTAVLSGFETLRDMHGRQLTEEQKIQNMRDMVAFVAASLPQGIERDRFAATTNPVLLIHGGSAGGMSVSGEMAMQTLFGRPYIETQWEACLFAAAFYTQIVIPAPSARPETVVARQELFLSTLESAKERARDECLARLEAEGQILGEMAEVAWGELEDFQPEVAVWTHGTRSHLPGAFAALRDESLLLGREAGGVETSLDPTAQSALSRAVFEIQTRTSSSIEEELCHTDCEEGQHSVDFLAVAVEFDDVSENVVAIHQSRGGLFHGPVVPDYDAYIRGEVTRSPGSLPKLYLGLRLAAAGITHLCPRDALGLSDADGALAADCRDRTQWLTLEESLARSSNRALAEGIRILGMPTVLEGLDLLGAEVADENDRRRIVTGVGVPISPERFMRFLAAVGRGIDGQAPSSYLPQIASGPRHGYLELPTDLFTANPTLLRRVLAAPVMHPMGTLRDLREPLRERGCDMSSIIAKTGSSETADEAGTGIRDRYIALQVTCPDATGEMRDIAVFTMIGSPQIDIPLTGVTAGDARALALETLDAGLVAASLETRHP
jgi:hypothetical protein